MCHTVGQVHSATAIPTLLESTKEILNFIFPRDVVGSSDVVQISNDLRNNIQDRSWMLYLSESFDSGATASNNFPIKLNLICQFNEFDHYLGNFCRGQQVQVYTF